MLTTTERLALERQIITSLIDTMRRLYRRK